MKSIQDEVNEVLGRTTELKAELERVKSEKSVNHTYYQERSFSPESQLVKYLHIPPPIEF